MVTPFGKFVRKLRIERDEILLNMAEKLKVTSSYLSAIENGKRKVPLAWADRLSELYNLEREKKEELVNTIFKSNESVNVVLENISDKKQDLAISFAREIGNMTEEQVIKLQKLINKGVD